MANKDFDNTNRFSLWSRDKGPVGFSGVVNVNGTDYALKLLRLAKESAKAYVIIEDKETFVAVGSGPLYDSKFDDIFLSGKINVRGTEFYMNMYKNSGGSEKSPTFSGKLKPVGEQASKPSAPVEDDGDDEW